MYKSEIKNNVVISGKVTSLKFEYKEFGKEFYSFKVACKRLSNTYDFIPVIISKESKYFKKIADGIKISIKGSFRSYNRVIGNKSNVILYVYPSNIKVLNADKDYEDKNLIELEGRICKNIIYRKTPLGRKISDVMIAINRNNGKTDYIPCIAWGNNAEKARKFNVSERIKITGRIQSREYRKITEKGEEIKTAYEVSCSTIAIVK